MCNVLFNKEENGNKPSDADGEDPNLSEGTLTPSSTLSPLSDVDTSTSTTTENSIDAPAPQDDTLQHLPSSSCALDITTGNIGRYLLADM